MKAFLDGLLLDEDSGAGWTQSVGESPHMRVFEIEASRAQSLFAKATLYGSVLTLDSTQEGLGTSTIRALTILGTSPSDNPHTLMLTVSDRRWTWGHPWFRRSYNARRKSGERRLVGEGVPRAAQLEVDIDTFIVWSLKDEATIWTGKEALDDAVEFVAARDGFAVRDESGVTSLIDVEGLEIDIDADVGLTQVMAYFGLALGLYIDDDGTAVLINRLDDGEFGLVGASVPGSEALRTVTRDQLEGLSHGPPLVGSPLWAVQDRSMERASEVRIHFTRAIELRVDFKESGFNASTLGAEPSWENVLPAPEDLTLGDREIVRGTWITFSEYITDFMGKQTPLIDDLPTLTFKVIREQFMGPIGLMAYAWPRLDLGGLWRRRISPIMQHYRLTLRLPKLWLDRIRNLRVYRVAVEDISTGARAPSLVYADHAIWLSGRPPLSKTENDPPEAHEIVRNVLANETSGPGVINETPLADLTPAEATLRLIDEDQGIVQFAYLLDIEGKTMNVIRSALLPTSIPTDDVAEDNVYLGDGILSEDHEMAIVVTVGMGSPNDERQFHTEVVTPEEALTKMPTNRIGVAKGPPVTLRVTVGDSVARFAWDDGKSDAIYVAFTDKAGLKEALGDPVNQSEVRDVALAEAARYYTSMVDHVEGSLTTAFAPGAKPRGTVASVSHEAKPGPLGGMVTTLDLPSEPPKISLDVLLSTGTRKIVRRQLDP